MRNPWLIGLVAAFSLPVMANEAALKKALRRPAATGLIVTRVQEGSEAEKAGVEVGDVLIRYAGKPVPTLAALNEAKEGVGEEDSIRLEAVRGGKAIVFSVPSGPIGFNAIAVEKGKAAPELPPDTAPVFDFRSLSKHPRDDWYEFVMPGAGKVGFEHAMLKLVDGELVLRREVAFDGGTRWGLNHFDVTVVMTATSPPRAVTTRFENPLTGWVGEGFHDEEEALWRFAYGGEGHERGTRSVPFQEDLIPDYIVDSLAAFLPRKKGACFHYHPLLTGWPGPSLESALHCAAEEELEIDGRKVRTFRFEAVGLGGVVSTRHWVDVSGRIVRSDYNGPIVTLTTESKALAGLDEKIEPRTASRKK